MDQTAKEFFNPSNAFDAEGLTRLTEETESRRKQRNDIEQDTEVQVRAKNLEAERLKLTQKAMRAVESKLQRLPALAKLDTG